MVNSHKILTEKKTKNKNIDGKTTKNEEIYAKRLQNPLKDCKINQRVISEHVFQLKRKRTFAKE